MKNVILPDGQSISIPEAPQRIVSFSPAITEILFELGLNDRIVGVSAYCSRPKAAQEKRRVGTYGSAEFDILAEISPDLILTTSGFQDPFSKKLSERYTTYSFEMPSSVAGIVDLVSKVGMVTGEIEESKHLEFELLKIIGGMRRHIQITGYVEIDLGTPFTFGSDSYINDALSIMGIKNIYGSTFSEWLKPDPDYVAEMNPDLIFYEHRMNSEFTERDLENLVRERRWDSLDSYKNGRIFLTPGKLDFFAHHGPSFIWNVLPWMQNILDDMIP